MSLCEWTCDQHNPVRLRPTKHRQRQALDFSPTNALPLTVVNGTEKHLEVNPIPNLPGLLIESIRFLSVEWSDYYYNF